MRLVWKRDGREVDQGALVEWGKGKSGEFIYLTADGLCAISTNPRGERVELKPETVGCKIVTG